MTPATAIATVSSTISLNSCTGAVHAHPRAFSASRRRNRRHSTARTPATESNWAGNAADGDGGIAVAAVDGPVHRYAAADIATSADCRNDYISAADLPPPPPPPAAAAAADGKGSGTGGYDYDGGDDDGDYYSCDEDYSEDGTREDEDAYVAAAPGTEDGREPLPLIRAPLPPRDLLALLLLPKQVRGPVREVEESEYDWEEDPRDDVDALGPRRELGQPRPAAVFFPWLHMYFALPQFIHRHGILRVSDERLLKEFGWY